MTDTRIDELTTAVERLLLRRGFVHEDQTAYRAGVTEAVDAVRRALVDAERDDREDRKSSRDTARRATADQRVA